MRRKNKPSDTKQSIQEGFNNFVEKYNHDYLFFLQRAATGYYNCLITAGRVLSDLHDFIIFVHRASDLELQIVPYPFTFRHGEEYYRELGFNDEEIEKIYAFFKYIKETYDKEFEECVKENKEFLCRV